jgi:hypothetical protein
VPKEPGPGRQVDSKDSPVGVSRFGGQAGTQATDPTPKPIQNRGSRAGALSRFHLSYLAFLQNGIEAPRQQMRILVDRVIYQGLRYAIKPTRRL